MTSTAGGLAIDLPGKDRRWTAHLVALGVLLAAISVFFAKPIVDAVEVWWIYPAYSHCFLILPISLWLIWERRHEISLEAPVATTVALWALPFVLLLWWIGEFATINEARQLAVIGFVQIAIWAMIGTRLYRMVLFPSLYLFFLVPMGEYLIAPLQRLTTHMADFGLTTLNIPHYTEGTTIELTNGRFEIAEACAGLRFLIATIALGVLYTHLSFRKWHKVAVFLASCIVIPIFANGLRVLGIILLAHFTNNRVGAGADHVVYGWGFNVAILLILLFIGSRFRDPVEAVSTSPALVASPDRRAVLAGTVLATIIAIGFGPATALWHDSRAIDTGLSAISRPLQLAGYHVTAPAGPWHPTYLGADAEFGVTLSRANASATQPVTLFVEYYGRARRGHSLITHMNHEWDSIAWHAVDTQSVSSRVGTVPVEFSETTISSGLNARLVWSTYWVGGRFMTSPLAVKLQQARAALLGNEGEAVVALSTPIEDSQDQARERIEGVLAELQDIPARLTDATTHRSQKEVQK